MYLVHHSHVDIGYTEPQPVVMRKHAEYVARALDYCRASDDLPLGERFAWTCEVSWTVKAFLERYPERAEELFRRVRERRIEVTAIYLNLTELFGESLLDYALSYATGLAREHGFEVVSAMNDDVNGWGWGLPRMLADRGVRYFDTAINNVRANNVEPRPRPYYWASPDGSRVLMWHGTSYLHGNGLGLHLGGVDDRLFGYLAELERSDYPHNAVQIKVQGEVNDNSPPGAWLSERVREWNSRYDSPKLVLGTSRDWFEHVEEYWPEPIPELRLAWPDWWSDGLGSYPYECMIVRQAQADLDSVCAMVKGKALVDQSRLRDARETTAFFCEHTGGAWCATDVPHSFESKAQQAVNSAFAYTAASESQALLRDTVASAAPAAKAPSVLVFNPLPYARTDLVEVTIRDDAFTPEREQYVITRERVDPGPALHLVEEGTGRLVPVCRRPHVHGATRYPAQIVSFVAHDVPPLGWRRYRIVAESDGTPGRCTAEGLSLNGPHFSLALDGRNGGIASALARNVARELVSDSDCTLNQYVHEFIDSPRGREDLCYWGERHTDTPFRRVTPRPDATTSEAFALGARLVAESGGGAVPHMRSEVVIYDDLPRIDIINTITKQPSDLSEAVYHVFPLAARSPVVHLDIPGAVMRPGPDQVPGTATDWYAIQRYFAVSDDGSTVVVASPDVPLVQVNGINTGRWRAALDPHNGTVVSWVMNNYWFTNWPAYQWGRFSYRYSIACLPGPFEVATAGRFASAIRQPLCGHVVPMP